VGEDRLRDAQHEARLEAAPFLLLAAGVDFGLAALSAWKGWELLRPGDWWVWILLALPALVLAGALLVGFGRLRHASHRRALVIALLVVLGASNATGILIVIVSLVDNANAPSGSQLLATALATLLMNIVTFALAFWELDSGGPVARALAERRERPDFQFPQDENPALASPGWQPALKDYMYVSVTNSIAFSPTDAMPLTHRVKLAMAVEAAVSAATVLIVASRAINILGPGP
jgi:hypothetical protein